MELIIGGIYQGKTKYAIEKLGIAPSEIYQCAKIPKVGTDNTERHMREAETDSIERHMREAETDSIERHMRESAIDDIEQHMRRAGCIDHLERYLWNCAALGREPLEPSVFCPDVVLICEDIFCGIVPIDGMERKWRQMAGRYLQKLTAHGARVTRVVCGIGMQSSAAAPVLNENGSCKRVLLIRHGSTEMGEAHQYCGSSDPPLSDAGREALAGLRERYRRSDGSDLTSDYSDVSEADAVLTEKVSNGKHQTVYYTSGLRRADETMEILFGACPAEGTQASEASERNAEAASALLNDGSNPEGTDSQIQRQYFRLPALREMDFGTFEGKTYEMLREMPQYQAWISGRNEENLCPGGESGAQMARRVWDAFVQIVRTETAPQIVIVSHGGPIAAILMHLMPDLSPNRYRWQPEYGGSWRLDIQIEKETLICRSCVPYV